MPDSVVSTVFSPRVLDTAAPLVTQSLLAATAPLDAVGEGIAILPQVPAETAEQIGNKPTGVSLIPGVGGYNRGQIQRRTGLDYQKRFKKNNSKFRHEIIGTYSNVLGIAAIGALATAIASKKEDRTFGNIGMSAVKWGTVGGFAQLMGTLAAGLTPSLTNEQLYQQEHKPAISNYLIPGIGAYRGYKRLGKGYTEYIEEPKEEKEKRDNHINNHRPIAKEASFFDWMGRMKGDADQDPDYDLDNRPGDLPPGIYQGSRTVLQGVPVAQDVLPGEHGYLFMVPKDKRKFREHLRDVGGGVRGILVSGYKMPSGAEGFMAKLKSNLEAEINRPKDVAGVKLLLSDRHDPKNINPKLYNVSGGIKDVDSKIREIVDMTRTYQQNTKVKPYGYNPFPKPGGPTGNANCMSWVNSVATLAKLKKRVKDYKGFDPGVTTDIPEELFKSFKS